MNTTILKDDMTLLVNASTLHETQRQLLKTNLKGIHLTTLSDFLLKKPIPWTTTYEAYHRFKKINHLEYFKDACSNAFIQECLSFLNILQGFNIPCSELPETTPIYRELKKLLTSIYDLPTQYGRMRQEAFTMTQDLSHVVIDIQYPTYFEQMIIEKLIENKAQRILDTSSTPTYSFHHANNIRCEIEAIAQKIIQENLPLKEIQLVLCGNNFPLVENVFERYHLPLFKASSTCSTLVYQTVALLEFAIKKTPASFQECLNQNCFGKLKDLKEVQKIYPYHYNENYPVIDKSKIQGECFSEHELNQLIALIEKGNIQKSSILPYIEKLIHADQISTLFLTIDEILRTFMDPTKENIQVLKKIQHVFYDCVSYVTTIHDLEICIEEIKKIRNTSKLQNMNALHVTSIHDVNHAYPITFLMQATQKDLTVQSLLPHLFNEDYCALIPSFPSQQKRYLYANEQLHQKLMKGDHIYISYPLSDYTGKNYEPSLIVEDLELNKSTAYPLISKPAIIEKIHSLSAEEAHSLYVKNHQLRGSVSSLEKYVGCPYAYFLKYGCHIQEPIEAGFNVQKIGTLNHAVLENLIHQYGKDYVHHTCDEIIDLNIADMKMIFPHLSFDLIALRLKESMKQNLSILLDMEKHSSLTPTYCEKKWEKDIEINPQTNLHLVGFIDRIDTSAGTFRILDYKSSEKKLSKEMVFSGQQLQLCTYLSMMKEELKLQPLGTFYYSFLNPKIELPYQKLSRRSKIVEEISEDTIKMELLKRKRLQGWIFDENVELMDDNASHVQGVFNTKNKGIHARQVLNIEEISEAISTMLKMIASSILSGNIECVPNESACLFCPYKPICRFNGTFTEKQPIVELPPCMRKEKENYE